MLIHVTDPHDDRLSDYTRLTDVALRSRSEPARGLYMAESSTVIRRAVRAGHRPRSFLMAERWLPDLDDLLVEVGAGTDGPVPVYVAEPPVLEAITGFHLHRGALAAMHRPVPPSVQDLLGGSTVAGPPRRVAVLEDVVDHTNIGAALRACAAMGVDAVLVTPSCADPLYRRAIRVSMGTVFQVPWTRFEQWPHGPKGGAPDGVDLLHELGYTVAALALDDDAVGLDELAADPPERLAMVFGTEGDGLKARTVAACDLTVRIPMAGGVDSLNVASAVAVATWATRPAPSVGRSG
ncbi:TrmH family RNA methyltransferase [Cellulomonas bogoriensis]|uniref:rRNA methyltransferase n=1 Tax=Cellulomonas bogoriensis 69B4 = DSM 16987 TaxID=1386082 RepID=A0A0A0BPG0_9CELL|nr:RNA methyltransferase [Cellulomonas bogoriensis]KGM10368.1 rRNA methyltransferase [Cellulomonas bogoriensis 69B4 = DSM 16987]